MKSTQLRLPGVPKRRPRSNAGRPPNGDRAGVSHLRRADFARTQPVHVTLRTLDGVPRMRRQRAVAAIERAFREARVRFGMRIVHYSIQGNHLHLIVEAEDRRALAKGMQGLGVRIAKALNRLVSRSGKVWADRYHSHALKSRREVANALRYVLQNFAHHFGKSGSVVDWASSARFLGVIELPDAPVATPRTWLLRVGWRGSRSRTAGRCQPAVAIGDFGDTTSASRRSGQ